MRWDYANVVLQRLAEVKLRRAVREVCRQYVPLGRPVTSYGLSTKWLAAKDLVDHEKILRCRNSVA